MQTKAVNNQYFGNNKFRVPVTLVTRTVEDTHYVNPIRIKGYVKEYSNPEAKNIYAKMQKEKNIYKRAELDQQMGDYEIKPLNIREKTKMFFRNLFV